MKFMKAVGRIFRRVVFSIAPFQTLSYKFLEELRFPLYTSILISHKTNVLKIVTLFQDIFVLGLISVHI
jgi:hypothetical protein